MTTADIAICVRNLGNRFGGTVVHEELDLDVRRGEILGVVGESGTGKSVLLRTIVGLNRAAAGRIRINGGDHSILSDAARRAALRCMGVLFQDGALFTSLTVAQNIQVPLREHFRLSQQLMNEIAAYKIGMVGLTPEAGPKFPADLSGGMRKRAGLARALALDPSILFLDEPTAGLDPPSATAFDRLIRKLTETLGLTVLLVTHDLNTLHAVCDRVAVLSDKRICHLGTIAEVQDVDHPWIREFFHGVRGRAARLAN